jgi:hypothetical protein
VSPKPLPIVVLGGHDPRAGAMPEGLHPLAGYKGVAVRIAGRAIIDWVTERLEESGLFAPVYIAGPKSVYAEHQGNASVIDVAGSVDETIRAGIEAVAREHPGAPVAITTCDVLPDVDTLARVMALYRAASPCDGFLPMIRAPEDHALLGASAYKPIYHVVPEPGEAPVEVLPCHLAVLDAAALRMEFIYRVLRLIYRTRNRPIAYRRAVVLRGIMFELLYQDALHLLGLRLPSLTWSVLHAGLPAVRALKAGTITRRHLEDAIRRIFVTARHQRRHPERRVHMPIVEGLSLALDIDTEEEAAAMGGELGRPGT